MESKYQAIILMGLQGSGKGTQGQLLKERLGFEFLEAGGMFRDEVKSNSLLGKKINEIINVKGELVPDEITKELILKKILSLPTDKTVVFDGYPRTMRQYIDLAGILKNINRKKAIVFNVKISDQEALRRLASRTLCQDCKTVHKGDSAKKCVKCGGLLIKRKDDTPEKINTRLAWSHKETDPVLLAYKKDGILIEINGAQDIESVYNDIIKYLE